MSFFDIFGFIAGLATTAGFIPQALKIFKTKKTADLSLGMFALTSFGVAMWDVYGILIHSFPIILFNTITLALALYVLIMKIRHG